MYKEFVFDLSLDLNKNVENLYFEYMSLLSQSYNFTENYSLGDHNNLIDNTNELLSHFSIELEKCYNTFKSKDKSIDDNNLMLFQREIKFLLIKSIKRVQM